MSYKLKTKSSVKKRFWRTKNGKGDKIILFHAKRRHNAQNRNRISLKQSRGNYAAEGDLHTVLAKIVKKR